MTGRERLLTALSGNRPDRVPATLFIQGQGHFANQIMPDVDPWDLIRLQKGIVDFQRGLGMDVHVRMLFYNSDDPLFTFCGQLNTQTETDEWRVKETTEAKGNTTLYKHEITTPEGVLKQTFSINELRDGTFMYACTEKPIISSDDLSIAMKYEPPISDEAKEKMKRNVAIIKDYVGDDGIVSGWSNGGLFNNISGLIDHTLLYSVFLIDPEYYQHLMQFAKKRVFSFTDAILDSGVDAVCIGGNVAGGFLGERFFEEYILPYEKEYVDYTQRKGQPLVYHNCGEVMSLIEPYKKLGAKNIEPFSPAPLGDGDLVKLHEMLNGEFTVTSGLDQVNVIQKGTVDLVKEKTREAIERGKQFDRFILQNVDFLEYGTPIENVEAYAKTALENAAY